MADEPPTESEFLGVKEACAYLGVSRATLDSYVRQGRISRYKSGAPIRTLYRRKALEKLKEVRQVKGKKQE